MDTFREKLESGFTLTFESDPPKGLLVEKSLELIAPYAPIYDAIMVADCTFATLRMSNLAFSHLVRSRFGTPVVMHQTARDLNVLGMHSHLMGAWALGIHNLLLMTGDPPRFGTFPEATPVYDMNSVKLVELVRRLNEGEVNVSPTDKIRGHSDFHIGVVANPYVPNLRAEVERLRKKHLNGAHFVVTQPIFDVRTAERFLEYSAHIPMKKILGVMAVKSFQNCLNIASLSPDLFIPAEVYERMKNNDTPEEGIAIAKDFIRAVRNSVDGIHIFPLHRYHILKEFVEFRRPTTLPQATTG
jgi:5,10-methylenetetrahydrofolate reductase